MRAQTISGGLSIEMTAFFDYELGSDEFYEEFEKVADGVFFYMHSIHSLPLSKFIDVKDTKANRRRLAEFIAEYHACGARYKDFHHDDIWDAFDEALYYLRNYRDDLIFFEELETVIKEAGLKQVKYLYDHIETRGYTPRDYAEVYYLKKDYFEGFEDYVHQRFWASPLILTVTINGIEISPESQGYWGEKYDKEKVADEIIRKAHFALDLDHEQETTLRIELNSILPKSLSEID